MNRENIWMCDPVLVNWVITSSFANCASELQNLCHKLLYHIRQCDLWHILHFDYAILICAWAHRTHLGKLTIELRKQLCAHNDVQCTWRLWRGTQTHTSYKSQLKWFFHRYARSRYIFHVKMSVLWWIKPQYITLNEFSFLEGTFKLRQSFFSAYFRKKKKMTNSRYASGEKKGGKVDTQS